MSRVTGEATGYTRGLTIRKGHFIAYLLRKKKKKNNTFKGVLYRLDENISYTNPFF